MIVVYIAHPISGDVKRNLEKVASIARYISMYQCGVIPFAPYYLGCHSLDDSVPAERERGIENNTWMIRSGVVNEMWLYGDRVSNGMQCEIDLCKSLGITIRSMSDGTSGWNH